MVSLLNNLAPQFSDTKEYKFGERFVFKGKLYQVMQSFSGEFDHTKTTEISIADMMKGCLPNETNGEAIGENINYIAEPFDETKTYEEGDYVVKDDGLLYELKDGAWVRTYLSENDEVGGGAPVLLWENPSPSSTFEEQTISLDLINYSKIIVESIDSSGNGCTAIINKNNSFIEGIGIDYSSISGVADTRGRLINATDTSVQIGNGYTNGNVDNSSMIPYRVYGVKDYIVSSNLGNLDGQYVRLNKETNCLELLDEDGFWISAVNLHSDTILLPSRLISWSTDLLTIKGTNQKDSITYEFKDNCIAAIVCAGYRTGPVLSSTTGEIITSYTGFSVSHYLVKGNIGDTLTFSYSTYSSYNDVNIIRIFFTKPTIRETILNEGSSYSDYSKTIDNSNHLDKGGYFVILTTTAHATEPNVSSSKTLTKIGSINNDSNGTAGYALYYYKFDKGEDVSAKITATSGILSSHLAFII